MIGTRTPFRISFAGGASDLREFYEHHPGFVVSATIDRYMYIFVHPFFEEKIQVKYSRTELVDRVEDIQHPIVREVLKQFAIGSIDVNSIADIPAGTGLGSSSAFTVGLLHALHAYTSRYVSKEELAQQACRVEIDILGEPIGKQDQYAVAYGGLNAITFHPNGQVNVEPILMPEDTQRRLEQSIVLFYLGAVRDARDVLDRQRTNIERDPQTRLNLVQMVALAQQLRISLQRGAIDDLGMILDESWQRKKRLGSMVSNDHIDAYYNEGKRHGALGGKLLGAGGGGFLLFYCPEERQGDLVAALHNLRPTRFSFDSFGTKIIYVSESLRPDRRPLGETHTRDAEHVHSAAVVAPGRRPPPGQDPVSVVINVYNEAATIEQEIREIQRVIVSRLPGSELIVAEDGSTDGTKEILERLKKSELGIVHSTGPVRKGYTAALRDALALARHPYIFFGDTGGKFDFEDFWKLYPFRQDYGIVIGVRTDRTDQLYRRALTWGYNTLVRQYFRVSLQDADSGFRLYQAELVKRLLREPWVYRNLIGSELAVRAIYAGYPVKEIPVTYRQRGTVSRGLPPQKIPRVIRQTLHSLSGLRRELTQQK